MSMAVGEYVSFSSQSDSEQADLARVGDGSHRRYRQIVRHGCLKKVQAQSFKGTSNNDGF
jgi:hypothetical protein